MNMNASEDKGAVHHRHKDHLFPSPPPSSSSSLFSTFSSSSSRLQLLPTTTTAAAILCQQQKTAVTDLDGEDRMVSNATKRLCIGSAPIISQQYSHWLLNAAASLCCWCCSSSSSSNGLSQPTNKTATSNLGLSCPYLPEDYRTQVPSSSNRMGTTASSAGLAQLRFFLLMLVTCAACLSVQVEPVVVHSASVIGAGGSGGAEHAHNLQKSHNHGQIIGSYLGGGEHNSARQQVVDIEEEAAAALIKQYHQKLEDESPPCADEHSICGYVQVNSIGFNRVSLCSCTSHGRGGSCPLWWERSTSRTVRHGNDFYKYCSSKPRLVPCAVGQLAYSAVTEYDKQTFEKMSVVHRAHCLCPADHILAANSSRPAFEQETESSVLFITEMLCTKIPRCSRKQFCLSISENVDATLEQRHCRCPLGQICPKDPRQAAKTEQMLRGAAYHMRCL